MDKIASPQELTSELRQLLAYAESENPSREKLATDLNGLATRVGSTTKVARDDVFYEIVDQRETVKLYHRLEKEDEQSAKLFYECLKEFQKAFEVDSGTQDALSRFKGMVSKGQNWDAGLLRNNVFKVANSLGLKLPSGMF